MTGLNPVSGAKNPNSLVDLLIHFPDVVVTWENIIIAYEGGMVTSEYAYD